MIPKSGNQPSEKIVRQRYQDFWKGFPAVPPADDLRGGYYSTVDILIGAEQRVGRDFIDYIMANYEPIAVLCSSPTNTTPCCSTAAA